jgi:hypothetical protein
MHVIEKLNLMSRIVWALIGVNIVSGGILVFRECTNMTTKGDHALTNSGIAAVTSLPSAIADYRPGAPEQTCIGVRTCSNNTTIGLNAFTDGKGPPIADLPPGAIGQTCIGDVCRYDYPGTMTNFETGCPSEKACGNK